MYLMEKPSIKEALLAILPVPLILGGIAAVQSITVEAQPTTHIGPLVEFAAAQPETPDLSNLQENNI